MVKGSAYVKALRLEVLVILSSTLDMNKVKSVRVECRLIDAYNMVESLNFI